MGGIKRIILSFSILLLAGGLFSFWRLLQFPQNFREPLVSQIEERLGARLSFQGAQFVFAPFPALQLEKPSLESVTEGFPAFSADRARFSFRLLPLLIGRLRISGLALRNGKGTLAGVELDHVDFKVRNLSPRRFAPFEGKASAAGGNQVLRGEGEVIFGNTKGKNFWTDWGLRGDLTLQDLSLGEGGGGDFLKRVQIPLSGMLAGKIHVEKEKGKDRLEGLVDFDVADFKAKDSLPFGVKGHIEILWDLLNQSVELQQVHVIIPFGELEGKGGVNVQTGEVGEVRFSARKVLLEELARHFPGFLAILPLDTGFSGESNFELTLQGTWDYLALHANLDLTPAVVTYGKIFSKPKDFPMEINCDFILKSGSLLSGDLSVWIRQTMTKGSITTLELATGLGEVTFLTNKFDLKDWETLLSPFTNYQLSGSAKVLLHFKGKLAEFNQTDKTLNLTLENATFLSPEGRGVRNAHLLLDMSALSLAVKQGHFQIGGSPLQVQAEIFGLNDNPQGQVTFSSPHLDPFEVTENLKGLASIFLPAKTVARATTLVQQTQPFLPQPLLLEDLSLHLKPQQGKLFLETLTFQALGGTVLIRGETEWPSERPPFWLEARLNQMNLSRYFEGIGQSEKFLDGNLFFKGKFQGQGFKAEEISKQLSGQGSLSITNGEWHALDLMGPLSRLEPFRRFATRQRASTFFHDLKANWNYQEGKFETKDFVLNSQDLWVEGKGNLSREGSLNARLEVFLTKSLTLEMLQAWGAGEKAQGKLLGPAPFLLLGSLSVPQVKADEKQMESFLEAIHSRKFRRILRSPFKED